MFSVDIRFYDKDEIVYLLGEYRKNEKGGNMSEFEFLANKFEWRKMK